MDNYSATKPLHPERNSTLYYYNCNTLLPQLRCYPWSNNIKEETLSPICKSVLQVSVLYMSRIGEILSLKVKNIVDPDRVICYGSKRSNGYLMYLPGLSTQVKEWQLKTKETPLFPLTYMKIYRSCIKAEILLNDGQGGNTKKCHAHRYLFARNEINSKGASGVKIALHHKSIKSQEPYLVDKGPYFPKEPEQTRLQFKEPFQIQSVENLEEEN